MLQLYVHKAVLYEKLKGCANKSANLLMSTSVTHFHLLWPAYDLSEKSKIF